MRWTVALLIVPYSRPHVVDDLAIDVAGGPAVIGDSGAERDEGSTPQPIVRVCAVERAGGRFEQLRLTGGKPGQDRFRCRSRSLNDPRDVPGGDGPLLTQQHARVRVHSGIVVAHPAD